ncbi:ATP-binding cassette domain-containing protein [Bacillus luteolus]|uniref:ATP-binding cassette domain-containing protein n=1 Tax=Litchfieldia luteola TaxID=682179 RepID=A0ABR9QJG2_9BACI|nr:ABC transporter transmembrane domain-containing protein [Cytobacillus luteolus]MBE4908629.1 ATP-binding cassette domain-containing protein [Cytobacillus luteolus]MBP1941485.1 ATP-binding cassette subfamily B protein [Cytobacillus luteolus]
MRVFKDLMWFFKQEKKSYLIGISLLCVVALLELVPPFVIGKVVDLIVEGQLTTKILTNWLGLLLVVATTVYIVRFFWRIMLFGASVRLARLLREKLYSHFTKMSQSFYQRRRIGDLMAHSTNDIQAVQQTAGAGVLTLVDSLVTGGFVLIMMAATISWKLTLISLIPMPLMALSTSWYGTLLHKRFHKAQEAFSSLNDKVQESVSGIKVLKTFGYEQDDVDSFREESAEVVRKNMKVAKIDALFDPTISLIVGFSFFLAVSFGSYFVLTDEMTLGQLISFTTYLGLLIWPMLAFGWLFNIVERGRASYDRVSSLLNEKVDIKDSEEVLNEQPSGNIIYAIKEFAFSDEQITLNDIQITLRQGETLGIVGKTGAGKTTLLKLLIREFEGYKGEITFGKHSISTYSLEALRKGIGYVPQDHFLFSATIADNIAFAKPNATYQEIIQAAELASIHEDIVSFTEGYETMVGERGVSLSGGQKQRISIARALIVNPEVLILDDSLSAVDAKTEEMILSALKQTREGKTTIITSHRLSAIAHANVIVVLEDGRIVQKGTHDELMNEQGWYKEMYHRQQLEALVEHGGM